MFAQGSLLNRVRVTTGDLTTLYTASLPTEITRIMICNTSGNTRTFSLFQNATDADDEFKIFADVGLTANATWGFETGAVGGGVFLREGESLSIEASNGNALTVFVYGITVSIIG